MRWLGFRAHECGAFGGALQVGVVLREFARIARAAWRNMSKTRTIGGFMRLLRGCAWVVYPRSFRFVADFPCFAASFNGVLLRFTALILRIMRGLGGGGYGGRSGCRIGGGGAERRGGPRVCVVRCPAGRGMGASDTCAAGSGLSDLAIPAG